MVFVILRFLMMLIMNLNIVRSNSELAYTTTKERAQDAWDEVRTAIDNFGEVRNCYVTLGNHQNPELFKHQKGSTTPTNRMALYSATKWVSGVTIMSAVNEGLLGLDDYAWQHLEYWTSDQSDARSRITLRHLLGFTSGYSGGFSCGSQSLSECTRTIYSSSSLNTDPGVAFDYNEKHLQIAGGIVEAATGLNFVELSEKYVFIPANMTNTYYTNTNNPALGAGISSTSEDYAKFLHLYFTNNLVPETVCKEMELDQYPEAKRSSFDAGWHYGLTNWFVCADDEWNLECEKEDVHQSGGVGGFRPTVNRRLNYWYNIAYAGIPGIGNGQSLRLHFALEPLIEKALLSVVN